MPQARLTLTIPEGVWVGRLTRQYDTVSVRVLAAIRNGDGGVALAKVTGQELRPFLHEINADETVAAFDILSHREDEALVQVETGLPMLLDAACESGIPLNLPFTVRGGEAVWSLTASHDRLSAFHDTLEEYGIAFIVDSVSGEYDRPEALTPHQREVIQTAVRMGYYDTPRQCTQEELADELGLAKSTCSESLHRAEEHVIKHYLTEPEGALGDARRSPKLAV